LCTSTGNLDEMLRSKLSDAVNIVDFGNKVYASRILGQMRTFHSYRKWLKANQPDAVLGTSNNISWFTGLGAIALGGRAPDFYIKTTNPIVRKVGGPFKTAFRKWGYDKLFSKAQAVLTLCKSESRIMEHAFPEHTGLFRAVYNPYLTEDFLRKNPAESQPATRRAAPVLFTAGRLESQKNLQRMIQAFALAKRKDDMAGTDHLRDAKLKIAGEGSQRKELEQLIDELGQNETIELLGFRDDVADLMTSADMFVLSSNYEGLPAVVIEALGSCIAVVTTDCFAAARELIGGLPGCAVTEMSPEALAEGIYQSLQNRSSNEILRERAANYSIASAAESHLSAMGL